MQKNYWNLIDLEGDFRKLPFSHGIEIEYFLLNDKYQPFSDNKIFKNIINSAGKKLRKYINNTYFIKKNILKTKFMNQDELRSENIKDLHKKFYTFTIIQKRSGSKVKETRFDLISRDTHFGSGNSLTLEIVTPPCDNLKEIIWWIQHLNICLFEACNKFKTHFLPLGGHPSLNRNFSGEHHHIGINKRNNRVKIYNVIRYFLPIFTTWNFNSFVKEQEKFISIGEGEEDDFLNSKAKLGFTKSIRLKKSEQIKPCPPIKNYSLEEFSLRSGITMDSARMMEMFPFTAYSTLEIRLFDTQLSLSRSIATVILLQALSIYGLDFSNSEINLISQIITTDLYNSYRTNYFRNGITSLNRFSHLKRSMPKEIKKICTLCKNCDDCKFKNDPSISCNFVGKTQHFDQIIKLYFFPKKYNLRQISIKSRTGSIQLRIILDILNPYIKKMRLNQNISLQTIYSSIFLLKEPSTYMLYQFAKNNGDIEKFGEAISKLQKKMYYNKTWWKEYYDPILEIYSKKIKSV